MTADDFFMLFIAFGGLVLFALVLWGFARVFDQKQEMKRGPDIRPDVGSPGGSNAHAPKEAARSGRGNDVLRCLAGWQPSRGVTTNV